MTKYTANKGEKEQAAKDVALCKELMTYTFQTEPYTYKGWAESSWDTKLKLVKGSKYVLVDRNCESHFVPFIAVFQGAHDTGEYKRDYERGRKHLLFKLEQDCSGAGPEKGDYVLAEPTIRIASCSGEIVMEFSCGINLGKDQKNKHRTREPEEF